MRIALNFYSYFKELAGCEKAEIEVPPGGTIGDFLQVVFARFPGLQPMRNSTLVAVGVEYQDHSYALHEGDEVSLFPPVQGG